MALRFCKSEHPATQHDFSWRHQSSHNLPLYSASYWNVAVTNPARRGENDHHRQTAPRTDTNQCRRRVAHDMAKGIQISRVTSANMTHSTKILAVNRKQLSSDIIDPPQFHIRVFLSFGLSVYFDNELSSSMCR